MPLETSLPLDGDGSRIAQARHVATAFLTKARDEAGIPVRQATVEIVQLIVSELVTNARKYAPGPAVLKLRIHVSVLSVELWDSSPVVPAAKAPNPERVGQHGLEIVAALAQNLIRGGDHGRQAHHCPPHAQRSHGLARRPSGMSASAMAKRTAPAPAAERGEGILGRQTECGLVEQHILQAGETIGHGRALMSRHRAKCLQQELLAAFAQLLQMPAARAGEGEKNFPAAVGARPAFYEAEGLETVD
ncbi:ATP-binding protein [Streptomyces sp. NPDC059980]|uniref:ATP-binding protein n=1 Tax=Streptomyces sp. NPDC059980 TaxID=3347022 RepID=UPI003683EE8A